MMQGSACKTSSLQFLGYMQSKGEYVTKPLNACEGDCDSDSECAGALVCTAPVNDRVSGCSGTATGSGDPTGKHEFCTGDEAVAVKSVAQDIVFGDGVAGFKQNVHFEAEKNKNVNVQVEPGVGFWWGSPIPSTKLECTETDFLYLAPPHGAISMTITYSGGYNVPSASLGLMLVLPVDDKSSRPNATGTLFLLDAWTTDTKGQSLVVNGETIYSKERVNVTNRADTLPLTKATINSGVKIGMCGYQSYAYAPRYIKSIRWNVECPTNTGVICSEKLQAQYCAQQSGSYPTVGVGKVDCVNRVRLAGNFLHESAGFEACLALCIQDPQAFAFMLVKATETSPTHCWCYTPDFDTPTVYNSSSVVDKFAGGTTVGLWKQSIEYYAQGFMITSRDAGCRGTSMIRSKGPTRNKIGLMYSHGRLNTNECTHAGGGTRVRLTKEECSRVAKTFNAAYAVVNLSHVPKGCYTGPDGTSPKDDLGNHVWVAVLFNVHLTGGFNPADSPLCSVLNTAALFGRAGYCSHYEQGGGVYDPDTMPHRPYELDVGQFDSVDDCIRRCGTLPECKGFNMFGSSFEVQPSCWFFSKPCLKGAIVPADVNHICGRNELNGTMNCNYDRAPAALVEGGSFAQCYAECKSNCTHCCADFRRSYYDRKQGNNHECFDRCHHEFDCEGVVCNTGTQCTSSGVIDEHRGLCAQNFTCAVEQGAEDQDQFQWVSGAKATIEVVYGPCNSVKSENLRCNNASLGENAFIAPASHPSHDGKTLEFKGKNSDYHGFGEDADVAGARGYQATLSSNKAVLTVLGAVSCISGDVIVLMEVDVYTCRKAAGDTSTAVMPDDTNLTTTSTTAYQQSKKDTSTAVMPDDTNLTTTSTTAYQQSKKGISFDLEPTKPPAEEVDESTTNHPIHTSSANKSSAGTVVGIVLPLVLLVAAGATFLALRKKEQRRQRSLTHVSVVNRQLHIARHENVHTNPTFVRGAVGQAVDLGNSSDDDSNTEDDLEPSSRGAPPVSTNTPYEPPPGLPPPLIYYSEVKQPANAGGGYATPNDVGAVYAELSAGGTGYAALADVGAVYAESGSLSAAEYAAPTDAGAVYRGVGGSTTAVYAAPNDVDAVYSGGGGGAVYTNDAYGNISGSTTNA
jgi:hypothetical protein